MSLLFPTFPIYILLHLMVNAAKVRVLCFSSCLTHTHRSFPVPIHAYYDNVVSNAVIFSSFLHLISDTNFAYTNSGTLNYQLQLLLLPTFTIMTMALHLPFDHLAKCLLEVLIGTQQMVSTPLQITRCTLY